MLNSINLNDKNYEDLYAEALAQIAIYALNAFFPSPS